jgi:O-acetyl-ADP-ribose deacetylase (regulator of RNase III)
MPQQRKCFIISPIGEEGSPTRKHADAVFTRLISPAMKALGLEAIRSDQLNEPGRISEQMFREILQDDLCIAILTERNPNVLYEIAVAQCASRPLILLLQKTEKLPFDVQDLRCIPYDFDPLTPQDQLYVDQIIATAKEAMGGTWDPWNPLEHFLSQLPIAIQRKIETSRPTPLKPGVAATYQLPGDPQRRIVIRTGGVQDVEGIDILVSSENTDLQLSRYYDPTMSGALRYLDAEKDAVGNVIGDAFRDNLSKVMQNLKISPPAMPGAVIPVPTTGLQEKGVQFVFHVAAVRGVVNSGYHPVEQLDLCVKNAFLQFAKLAKGHDIKSMLLPLFGAGSAKLDPLQAAQKILPAVVDAMTATLACRTAYILAWLDSHKKALQEVAEDLGLQETS